MKQSFDQSSLVKLFGSTSRARILDLLSSRPYQSLYQREIVFETGLSLQAVQRELRNLVDLGILQKRGASRRVYYRMNPRSPYCQPLKEICTDGRASRQGP